MPVRSVGERTSAAEPSGPAVFRRPGSIAIAAVVVAILMILPIASVVGNVFTPGTSGTWAHLASTVLPDYIATTLWLCLGVGLLATVIGVGTAWLVTQLEFRGRRWFEWALLLPLAMPAYVMAYAYTDLLEFAGPVQTAVRDLLGTAPAGWRFPDIRSLGGAVLMFAFVLYPYVFLLARTAFLERSGALLEAGRSLGLNAWQTFWRLSLPVARPAIAAGVALVLMETLADYGTVSYFGVQTFTTGIYRAWFSLGDRAAAAQLATCLLVFVVILLALEQQSRGHARYYSNGARRRPVRPQPLTGLRAAVAISACAVPLLMGFLIPAGVLLHLALTDGDAQWGPRFFRLAGNSMLVASLTAILAVAAALVVALARRLEPSAATRMAHGVAGWGYAVPGSVIAVGLLIPLARFDNALAQWLQVNLGVAPGLLITGSIAALVMAYLVRFLSAALQSVDSALARITPHMEDAARSLGLTPPATLRRVHLPLMRRGLLTAGLLVFIEVMKELPATLVMRPFNFDTLATQAYTLASDERLAEASTSTLAIVAVGLLPMIVLCRQIARERRPAES